MRSMTESLVRTRFAPSPTGHMHLGNARTALFNWLLARRCGGTFILRAEDTDRARSRDEFLDTIREDLDWLRLDRDEGPDRGGPFAPYRQSARGEMYAHHFAALEESGAAYPCYCSGDELARARRAQIAAGQPPRYAGTCRGLDSGARARLSGSGRVATLRFRVPEGRLVGFTDLVRGAQRFASEDIGDFIVRRADGTPSFFFGNALDDALMKVTHVLRGEDHLANTPRQLLLLEAFRLPAPQYGHVSLLTAGDGTPLSKRHGSPGVRDLARQGFLPMAVVNYLARLGHACADDGYLDLSGLAAQFDVARLGRAPARFDRRQLEHWQREAVRHADPVALADWLDEALTPVPAPLRERFIALVAPNVLFPAHAREWADVLFGELPDTGAEERRVLEGAGAVFRSALAALAVLGDRGGADLGAIHEQVSCATGERGRNVFLPLRLALTGRRDGPELERLIAVLPPETLRRRLSRWAG